MANLTDYQAAQLLHVHFTGDFKYHNVKGNKVGRAAWRKMIDALLNEGLIDGRCKITERGQVIWLSKYTLSIMYRITASTTVRVLLAPSGLQKRRFNSFEGASSARALPYSVQEV